MSWEQDIDRFQRKLDRNIKRVHTFCADEIKKSVKFGSALTGAPGQPVDTGFLRNSWVDEYPAPLVWKIETAAAYAPVVEEGGLTVRGRSGALSGGNYTLRSETGGFHSVRLTRVAFPRVVQSSVRKAIANG